ncbi:MAG: phosphoribosyltransferase family protein [Nitrosopumilaceae archaeon]
MFTNRKEAGKLLAEKLSHLKGDKIIVLAIPRGGVIVGDEIAKKLACTLDVVISRKITPPDQPEYAIGAVMHDETLHIHWPSYSTDPYFIKEIEDKKKEARRRLKTFRGKYDYDLHDKTVILVDDGIATGSSVFVILKWLSKQGVKKKIIAVPVIPKQTYDAMKRITDHIIALEVPEEFISVSQFYKEFDQVSDNEVLSILNKYNN